MEDNHIIDFLNEPENACCLYWSYHLFSILSLMCCFVGIFLSITIIGFPVGVVVLLVSLCFLYMNIIIVVIYFLNCNIETKDYTSEEVLEYVKKMKETPPCGSYIEVSCYHNSRKEIEEKDNENSVEENSFSSTHELRISDWIDQSRDPFEFPIPNDNIFIRSVRDISFSDFTKNYLSRLKEYLYEKNKHRDEKCKVKFFFPSIEGQVPEIVFSKSNSLPCCISCIKPKGSVCGMFCFLIGCFNVFKSHYFKRFKKVKFEIKKVINRIECPDFEEKISQDGVVDFVDPPEEISLVTENSAIQRFNEGTPLIDSDN